MNVIHKARRLGFAGDPRVAFAWAGWNGAARCRAEDAALEQQEVGASGHSRRLVGIHSLQIMTRIEGALYWPTGSKYWREAA